MRLLVITIGLLSACDLDTVVERAVFSQDELHVEVPATGRVGVPLVVGIASWGGCIEAEESAVSYVGDTHAIVEAFHRRHLECNILKLCGVLHEAEVRFDTPGNKVILFRGRSRNQVVDIPTTVLVE